MWGKCGEIRENKIAKSLVIRGLAITFELNSYPEPGSNRHGLPHWCLRPARLPIPPSGLVKRCKSNTFILPVQNFLDLFQFISCSQKLEVLFRSGRKKEKSEKSEKSLAMWKVMFNFAYF